MNPKWLAFILALATGLLIMGALLPGRYLFLLDSTFGPEPELFNSYRPSVLMLHSLLWIAKQTAPWLYPKWFMLLSIVLAYYFAYILLSNRVTHKTALLFAFFYAANPFIYNRLISGQVFIPFSYALLPLVAYLSMKKFSWKNELVLALIIALGCLQIHFLAIMLLVYLAISIFARKPITAILTVVLISIALNIPVLFESGEKLSEVSSLDLLVFRPEMNLRFSQLLMLTTLHGFWRQHAYMQLWQFTPVAWLLPFFWLIYLTAEGYLSKPKHRNPMLLLLLFGILMPIAMMIFGNFTLALSNYFPFLLAFRDSQKLTALTALGYLYLGAFGLEQLNKTKLKHVFWLLTLAFFLFIAWPMLFGFQAQIKPADYPSDYYTAKSIIDSDNDSFEVLFLPWHMYMDFKWLPNSDKRINTPIAKLLTKPVLTSTNPELTKAAAKPKINTSIKYIILAKEVDYRSYLYLLNQTELILNTSNLYLLRNPNFKS